MQKTGGKGAGVGGGAAGAILVSDFQHMSRVKARKASVSECERTRFNNGPKTLCHSLQGRVFNAWCYVRHWNAFPSRAQVLLQYALLVLTN